MEVPRDKRKRATGRSVDISYVQLILVGCIASVLRDSASLSFFTATAAPAGSLPLPVDAVSSSLLGAQPASALPFNLLSRLCLILYDTILVNVYEYLLC